MPGRSPTHAVAAGLQRYSRFRTTPFTTVSQSSSPAAGASVFTEKKNQSSRNRSPKSWGCRHSRGRERNLARQLHALRLGIHRSGGEDAAATLKTRRQTRRCRFQPGFENTPTAASRSMKTPGETEARMLESNPPRDSRCDSSRTMSRGASAPLACSLARSRRISGTSDR